MAIWDDIRKGLKKIGNAANDGVKKVSRAADSAARKVEDTGKKGVRAVEDGGKKAIREVEGAGNNAKEEIVSFGEEAKSGLQEAAELGKQSIEEAVEAAQEEIGEGLEGLVESALETAFETIFEEAAEKLRATQEKVEKWSADHPDLVAGLNDINFTVDLNVVQLHYGNFFERIASTIEVLDSLANEPPAFRRRDILNAIEALGPDSIDCGFTVPIAIVGLQFGGFSLGLFLALGDMALEEVGVPE